MAGWKNSRKMSAEKHWIWPVLLGLDALNIQALAHISVHFDVATKTFEIPKRVWVQITTLPKETNRAGIPIVVEDGKVIVEHLWGGDNGTYDPRQLLAEDEDDPRQSDPEFWRAFFLGKLQEVKAAKEEEAKLAAAEAALYSIVPS